MFQFEKAHNINVCVRGVMFHFNNGNNLKKKINVSTGLLWAVGVTSRRMDAKNIEIFGHSMEWVGAASRRIYQQTKRRFVIQVCLFICLMHEMLIY